MPCKKTVMLLLSALLLLSGCGQRASLYPAKPTLSELGPNMQDEMERAFQESGSWDTRPNVKPTVRSGLDSNHL